MRPIRANKTLGQNFLKSRRALGQIVRAAEIAPASATGEQETVLEIGPGKGVLTRVLLEAGARVVAVEKDERLVELLQETFAAEIAAGTLVLKAGDILELDLASDAARALFPAGGLEYQGEYERPPLRQHEPSVG
jgi:16S rRNA (adenine1518-N6/adenine1519-N6)-dimethyltransferase